MKSLIKDVYMQNNCIVIEKLYNYHDPYIEKIRLSKDEAKILAEKILNMLNNKNT